MRGSELKQGVAGTDCNGYEVRNVVDDQDEIESRVPRFIMGSREGMTRDRTKTVYIVE